MAQRSIVVTAEGGLHARPAAELVRLAQTLSGGLRIRAGAETVDAASVLSLMELALVPGDRVVLEADGEGADAALTAAAALLAPA